MSLKANKRGALSTGFLLTMTGVGMLVFSFVTSFFSLLTYLNNAGTAGGFLGDLSGLLNSAVVIMFLAVMGWVGSIFLLRGLEANRYEKQAALLELELERASEPQAALTQQQGAQPLTEQQLTVERIRARKNRIYTRSSSSNSNATIEKES